MEKMRLDKYLTSQNICSRKEAGILARKGEITVNGAVVKNADIKIDADTALVTVKGKKVEYIVGTMIELPRAALMAEDIAQSAANRRCNYFIHRFPPLKLHKYYTNLMG